MSFAHPIPVDRIGDAGLSGRLTAGEGERAALADLYDLEALRALDFDYEIRPLGQGRFALAGTLRALVTQLCVVTLEPIESKLTVPVTAEFWPEHALEGQGGDIHELAGEPEQPDPPEAIVAGRIDLGVLAAETLATSLDPYPRKPDAAFSWIEDEGDPEPRREAGPFAALAKLKR